MATEEPQSSSKAVRFTEPAKEPPAAVNSMTEKAKDSPLLMEQTENPDIAALTPITPEVISRQATINIGTIGHVAHGKSTIVKAISGKNTVRFKRELERNITIKLGYANAKLYKIDIDTIEEGKPPSDDQEDWSMEPDFYCARAFNHPDNFIVDTAPLKERYGENARYQCVRHVSFVDCPGHDILMATMLTGAAIMDAALLLIAANEECPQPQTNEHMAAIEIMKLKHIIILQNKIDLVTKDDGQAQYNKITEFIAGTQAKNSPVIPVSAQLKLNIDLLIQMMVRNIPIPMRDYTKSPRLSVIRSFDINKPGTQIDDLEGGICGGSILYGVLKIGDQVEIRPGYSYKEEDGTWRCRPYITTIRNLKAEENSLKYAVPGGLIAVGTNLDPYSCRADGMVGNLLGMPGTLPPVYDKIQVRFHLMTRVVGSASGRNRKIEKLERNEMLQVNIGSLATTAMVMNVEHEVCRLSLTSLVCTDEQEKVALSRRVDRVWRLIGWGTIERGHQVPMN